MKKVKIFFHVDKLHPVGGPAGSLWNLMQGLNHVKHMDIEISFLPQSVATIEDNQKLRSMLPNRIKDVRRAWKFANYLKRESSLNYDLSNYDAVHFHSTEDLYFNRKVLKNYKGKVILTSHTPCAPYKEIIGRLNPLDYKLFKRRIDQLEQMDCYAFKRADYIIFPCEEAEEPFYHTWEQYSDIRDGSKYRFMPTGIMECTAKHSRKEIREKYAIPENAFLISYVGRHNEIKGYGDLKEIGEKLLKDRDVYFLIAGAEEPMAGLEDKHWIEVGWTNDPHSLIAAADVFVLPNRETYFDLILLEVMSLGVPIVLSNTGGNKFFRQYSLMGMRYYTSMPEAIEQLLYFKRMQDKDREIAKNELKALYYREYSLEMFANRYIETLESIFEES